MSGILTLPEILSNIVHHLDSKFVLRTLSILSIIDKHFRMKIAEILHNVQRLSISGNDHRYFNISSRLSSLKYLSCVEFNRSDWNESLNPACFSSIEILKIDFRDIIDSVYNGYKFPKMINLDTLICRYGEYVLDDETEMRLDYKLYPKMTYLRLSGNFLYDLDKISILSKLHISDIDLDIDKIFLINRLKISQLYLERVEFNHNHPISIDSLTNIGLTRTRCNISNMFRLRSIWLNDLISDTIWIKDVPNARIYVDNKEYKIFQRL